MEEGTNSILKDIKRRISVDKGKIKVTTDIMKGFKYAFYLKHSSGIEKKFYSDSSSHVFDVSFEEGNFEAIFFYKINNSVFSANEFFLINQFNKVIVINKKISNSLNDERNNRITKDLIKVQNRLYLQLESLSWLQRRLLHKTQLPPLRGWACSPDVLLRLHTHIVNTKPKVIVEFGSGASTLVIADAISQNGDGKLFSIEHSEYYGKQTLSQLEQNGLQHSIELRTGSLELWGEEHLNLKDASKPSLWYPKSLLQDIENIDLIWVDGPPGNTCLYSRYPALPALSTQLSEHAEVWMDDTVRQEERDICEDWAQKYGFNIQYYPLEKGLGRLTVSLKK